MEKCKETYMYTNKFDKLAEEVLKKLSEDGEMGTAGYVDASVDNPGSADAIYTVARPYRKNKKLRKNKNLMFRRKLKTPKVK